MALQSLRTYAGADAHNTRPSASEHRFAIFIEENIGQMSHAGKIGRLPDAWLRPSTQTASHVQPEDGNMSRQFDSYSGTSKIVHGGLAIFGIAAYLTAEGAEGGHAGAGYLLHAYLGLTLTAFVALRLMRGFAATDKMNFSRWHLLSLQQWRLARQDLAGLVKLRVPNRASHEGLAGLVQAFGLVLFAAMAVTGTGLHFLEEHVTGGLYRSLEEVHELGELLIPTFLLLHIGAVIAHSLVGRPVWHRMWRYSRKPEQSVETTQ